MQHRQLGASCGLQKAIARCRRCRLRSLNWFLGVDDFTVICTNMHAIACELKARTDREIGGKRFKEREGTERDIIHFNSGQEVAWRSGGQATPSHLAEGNDGSASEEHGTLGLGIKLCAVTLVALLCLHGVNSSQR